jgi:hypothetical protein
VTDPSAQAWVERLLERAVKAETALAGAHRVMTEHLAGCHDRPCHTCEAIERHAERD